MDEVVFSYITSVLEELGLPESSEENFDMDTFVEMMEAYIPGFAEINRWVTVLTQAVPTLGSGPQYQGPQCCSQMCASNSVLWFKVPHHAVRPLQDIGSSIEINSLHAVPVYFSALPITLVYLVH